MDYYGWQSYSWTVSRREKHRQGTKLVSGKIAFLLIVLDKRFVFVYLSRDSRFHSKNNTSELRFLVSSALSVLKGDSTNSQISLLLSTAAPYFTSKEKFLARKNRVIRTAQKGQKQGVDQKPNALTFLFTLSCNGPLARRGLSNTIFLISLHVTSGALLEHFRWRPLYN